MINAGTKKDPKPTTANADNITHRVLDRDLAVVMREKSVKSPQLDERKEFYRNVGRRVIAGKYYSLAETRMPRSFSPL
jgi:hypothetical protein